ncbi:MAG TPA: carbohydrate-binding module family 20 domain-containing protein, partial [Flavisolibacter sp.]|nr:carbohydrate-binding module family 20 domain-containing protein [Flavisolibacter sp.]
MKIDFYLHFHTIFGQTIALSGNLSSLGANDATKALPLTYLSDDYWHTAIEIDPSEYNFIEYRYLFNNEKKERKKEGEKDRLIDLKKITRDLILIDTWNDESYFENVFFTAPFKEIFFRDAKKVKLKKEEKATHTFKVKAPLISNNESICLVGSDEKLNNWDISNPVLLNRKGSWWTVNIDLSAAVFPISYKYGVYNYKKESFTRFEDGDNRVLNNNGCENKLTIIHDGFA